ncbi:pseudouridine synthase [Candidatus Woesearchaeota archaeon]|nr:pseudouridine synthase [Candidatus Woesearchaeota archaeon]
MLQRVQKILSAAGVASRRKSEELILQGRVRVNGKVAVIGQQAELGSDEITVDGKRVAAERKRYILLYKPSGYVTTTADKFATKLVTDLVDVPETVYPVGRLDVDAEGLLILTNDGEFANRVMHPRFEVEKTYVVKLKDKLRPEDVSAITRGIYVDNRRVSAKIRQIEKNIAEVVVHEGRHKVVKRLFKAVGNYVHRITRSRIGPIGVGKLKPGLWRDLTGEEVELLLSGNKVRQSVDIVVRRDGNILLGKIAEKWSGGGKYLWGLPGREISNFGESAVRKQLLDETGLSLEAFSVFCKNEVTGLGKKYLVTGIVATASGNPRVTKPADWESWQWFPANKLPSSLFPSAAKTLHSFLSRKEPGKHAGAYFHRDSVDKLRAKEH